jgi:hypothetical protein
LTAKLFNLTAINLFSVLVSQPTLLTRSHVLSIENWAIAFWKHNGYWLFASPQIILELAASQQADLSGMTTFYYEVYKQEYDETTKGWSMFSPEVEFKTAVVPPREKRLAGFDVVTFSVKTSPECSPLSCNSSATKISVNEHCLLNTLDEAKCALETEKFRNTEPGPYRIFAVYKPDPNPPTPRTNLKHRATKL